MFKKYIDKIKNTLNQKMDMNNKKSIENLVVFLILLIITIIAVNTIWGNNDKNAEEKENTYSYKQLAENVDNTIIGNNFDNYEYNLEDSLEEILSKISGVRECSSFSYIF